MKRTGFDTMSPFLYPFYIMRHPRDGFLELKVNKKGSPKVVGVILALWLFVELFYRSATGFDMNTTENESASLLRTSLVTIVMYVMVCLCNWCICTLIDGKGKLADICVVTAIALVPYIIIRFITTVCSWFLAGDEEMILTYLVTISQIWGALIAYNGLQEIHEYSFAKTAISIILTFAGLIIMFFIALLLLMLFQQLYFFVATVASEIIY